MYTADGVFCYATPLEGKRNIKTKLVHSKVESLKPRDLLVLPFDTTDGLYNFLNLSDMCCSCFSAVSSLFVCCCTSCCQHKIL